MSADTPENRPPSGPPPAPPASAPESPWSSVPGAAGATPAPPPVSPWWPQPTPSVEPPRRAPRAKVVVATILAGLVAGAAVATPVVLLTRGHKANNTPGSGVGQLPLRTPLPGGTGSGSGALAARQLYQQALNATRVSTGVHYVANTSGAGSQKTVGDAGQADGTQTITVTSSFGAEQFSLVLVKGVVYFQGNTPAVEDQLGVPATKAPALNGKWVSVSSGDGPYVVLQPGITTADQAKEMPLVASSTQQVTEADGTTATRIRGTVPAQANVPAGTGYLDVAPGSNLPITYVTTITAGTLTLSSTVTFSAWGTAPSPSAPSGAVAWPTLGASEPPGGYGGGGGGGGGNTTPPAV
jgi:hypothetical protein